MFLLLLSHWAASTYVSNHSHVYEIAEHLVEATSATGYFNLPLHLTEINTMIINTPLVYLIWVWAVCSITSTPLTCTAIDIIPRCTTIRLADHFVPMSYLYSSLHILTMDIHTESTQCSSLPLKIRLSCLISVYCNRSLSHHNIMISEVIVILHHSIYDRRHMFLHSSRVS